MARALFTWSLAAGSVAVVASTSGFAADYLTIPQAEEALLPGVALNPVEVHLTETQRREIAHRSGVRVRRAELQAWRAADGSWFLVDEVLGKHEFITYACAIDPTGAVIGVEILSYRETYGGEVRRPEWLRQFAGKTAASPLKLDRDIRNISGATLSSRHVTDGVKRLLATHELVLRHLR